MAKGVAAPGKIDGRKHRKRNSVYTFHFALRVQPDSAERMKRLAARDGQSLGELFDEMLALREQQDDPDRPNPKSRGKHAEPEPR